jgi:UDP-glucose 4-epimerase
MGMQDVFHGKRIMITGGLGFIGSNLARRLVGWGAEVTLVDNLMPEYGGNLFNIAEFKDRVAVSITDVRNTHAMRELVKGQEYIFNLAGQSSHMDSMRDPYTDLEINCHAQLTLLEICREVSPQTKIIFASTRQIYGKPEYLPVDEKHLLRPVDVNGVNKMAGEWYHILYNNVYDIQGCSLRLTNTIGPRMRIKDARQTFLGVWIRLLLEGKPFEVWDGEQLRDFTYVDDAVDAFLLAGARPEANGHVYNLGGDCTISLKDLAQMLVDISGSGEYTVKEYPSDRKRIDIGDYYADYSKIKSELGWEPRTTLREGLTRILAYYRENLAEYI